MLDAIRRTAFVLTGRTPGRRGYAAYKAHAIARALDAQIPTGGALPPGYGLRLDERIVEYPWLFARLPAGKGRLLDAGSALNHEYLLQREPLRSKTVFVSTLAPEGVAFWSRGVSYVYEDLRETCFRDDYFDHVASISTIEHIGMDNTLYTSDSSKNEHAPESRLLAISEFRRVLRPGGTLFVTVPFGEARDHGWFQVFDGEMLDEVISAFAPSRIEETHYRYSPEGWRMSNRADSGGAIFFDAHVQSRHDADFAAAARAVACLELHK